MRRRASRAWYGVRALILIPTMIILGLALYVYDRLARRLKPRRARKGTERS